MPSVKKKKKVSSLPSSKTQTEVLPLANLKFQRVEVVLFSPLQHRVERQPVNIHYRMSHISSQTARCLVETSWLLSTKDFGALVGIHPCYLNSNEIWWAKGSLSWIWAVCLRYFNSVDGLSLSLYLFFFSYHLHTGKRTFNVSFLKEKPWIYHL